MRSRQINRAKRHSSSCKNNGSCPYCKSSRTHSSKRRLPAPDKGIEPPQSELYTQQ